jgi:hypothetical protein
LGYDTNFQFLVGLARVKAKTLSKVSLGSRVRLGPGQEARLRQIPYPGGRVSRLRLAGLSRIAGLSWDRAKHLTQIWLSLIP